MNSSSNLEMKHGYLVEESTHIADNLKDLSPQERYQKRQLRKEKILHASKVDIFVCILFAIIKFIIGLISNSLAIESDAVSSLTESYSSIVSIVGISLAHKKPTKKHPNGFGRIEFLTAVIGAMFVIIAGWHYFETSIERIITPEASTVTLPQLIIIGMTILGKLYLYKDNKETGTEYHSSGLITASRNALLSCFATALVIIAALIYQYLHIDIDGYVGLVISLLMLATGFIGIKDGMTPLLGAPVSKQTADAITEILLKQKSILGVYDIRIINNGAGILRGTANVEVPEDLDAEEVYTEFRKARNEIYRKLGIDMTLGLITVNYCNTEITPIYNKIYPEVMAIKGVKNIHGFNWNRETNEVDIHVTVEFKYINDISIEKDITKIIKQYIPDADVLVDVNVNYMESDELKNHASCDIPAKKKTPTETTT